MKRLLPTLALSGLLLATSYLVPLQGQVSFDFATEAQFTDNFRIKTPGTHLTWQPPGLVQGRQGSIHYGSAIYDTDPTSPTLTNTNFLTEEIRADVAWNTLSTAPSFQFFTRVQSDTERGVLGRVFLVSSTNIRIQLRYDAAINVHPADPAQGSIRFFDWEYNVFAGGAGIYHMPGGSGGSGTTGNTLSTGEFYTISLEQTAGPDPSFRVTAYTLGGTLLATSGFQTLGDTSAYDGPGAVGFGSIAGGSGAQIMQIDNFAVIPEPAHGAVVLALALGLFAWIRRARRG